MKVLGVVLLLGLLVVASGCTAFALSPTMAGLVTSTKGPVAGVDNSVQPLKKGTSEAQAILVVAWGDASISAAMQNGGITKVHHVDHESLSVLGVYSVWRTIVYGE